MKYYSEELKKFFDSEKDLVSAEKEFKDKQLVAETTKKEMARSVQECEDRVDKAYEAYHKALEEASKIREEAETHVKEVLDPAIQEIDKANAERARAIKNFNQKYGVYTATYTGEKAMKEYERVSKQFCDLLKIHFNPHTFLW